MSNEIKPLEPSGLIYLLKKIYSKIATSNKNTKDSAKNYTDEKIANLINGAPSTLDTLGEIAQAMSDNKDVVDALEEAIGTKATSTDLTTHTGNTSNPHEVTKAQVGLNKVENKSSADIRSELTKEDVTTALGFTPPTSNTTYSAVTQSANGLMSADDKKKLDGIANSANNYSLPAATSTVRGGVKIGYTANGKNYPVQLSDEQMYVNVPWTDNNTTYSNFVKSGSGAKSGLVPAPSTTAGTTKYLREDGTWQVPPDNNTTYSAATTSANGLMSKEDKTKLDGIDSEANKYSLPTAAKDTLGGVKTTSTVTSTTGLTAAPIINGNVYYKNTTYSDATQDKSGLMSVADKIKLNSLDLSVFSWGNKYTIPASTGSAGGTQVKIPINGTINKNNYCLLFIIGAYSALYFINYAFESRQELVWGDDTAFEISRTNAYEIGVKCKSGNIYSHTCYVINIETSNAKNSGN